MTTRYFSWGLLVCVALGFNLPSLAEEKPAGVSEESYANFMATKVLDVQDLAEGAEIQRRMFNRMTPSEFSWLQPMFPSVAPFDAKYFDGSFLDGLLGEETNSVAVYPLSLVLDPKTRETLIYNAEGKLIATVPSDGVSRTWPEDADPARVTLRLDLLANEDVEPYLYTEDRVATSMASTSTKSKTPKPGGFAMKSLETNEFGFADIQKLTNGNMQLTVTNGADVAEVFSYTVLHTSSVVVITWTNEESNVVTDTNTLWTPVSPPFNGLEGEWDFGTTNLVMTNGVGIWEDSNISSNDRIRFYGLANRADTDGDLLTDGAEYFVHHSNPGLSDTDEDGIPDGAEIGMGLNPLNAADAEEDLDSDHLVNREEYELGLPINESNEVTMVYFNPNPPAANKTMGDPANVEYVTWSNLQAKAISTIRQKEGYPEYTDETLPPSNPPKWYLSRDWSYGAETDGASDEFDLVHSEHVHCRKDFDPNGWPGSPTNHICAGNGHLVESWFPDGYLFSTYGWDYSFEQPASTVPVEYYLTWEDTGETAYDTEYWSSCVFGYSVEAESGSHTYYSHTQTYVSNDWEWWNMAYLTVDPGAYEFSLATLTNEYTDEMLLFNTEADLLPLSYMDELDWGQRWARDNHRQEPYEENLPTNEIYSACLISTNNSQLQIQDLQYRWSIPTTTGVHYKLMWLEAFRPQDSKTYSEFTMHSNVFNGTGSEYVYDADPLAHPWDYGTIEPVGFVVKLECSRATNSPMSFGDEPPGPVCYTVIDDAKEAAKSDQNKINSALTIFFKDASTPEGDPAEFDVTLRVYPETLPSVTWELDEESPDSGELLNADQPVATFQNPTKGGLYKFETTIPGIPTITSQLWLPVSGPDISVDCQREIDYLKTWIVVYEAYLPTRALTNLNWDFIRDTNLFANEICRLRWEDLISLGLHFDYETPNSRLQDICGLAHEETSDDSAGDSARFVIPGTSRPYVVDYAKRNNMGFAIYASLLGYEPWMIYIGPNAYRIIKDKKVGSKDDQYAIASYDAGIALAAGGSLPIVMNNFAQAMQHPQMRVSTEWPGDGIAETNCIYLLETTRTHLEKAAGR